MRRVLNSDRAPAAVGPYSQAVVAAGCVWISGQIPIDPATGSLVDGGIERQTRQVLDNLAAILAEAGSSMDRVVKATVYLTDLDNFEVVNRTYAEFFGDEPPARACVEVSRLPKGAEVEIDLVATVEGAS